MGVAGHSGGPKNSSTFCGTLVRLSAKLLGMTLPSRLQGRPFGPARLAEIQSLLTGHPQASRYELSRRLARLWDWRTARGELKDMAVRSLLLKLHRQGWIQLPAPRRASPTRSGRPVSGGDLRPWDASPVAGPLATLGPLVIEEVSRLGRHERRAQLEACLERYHYLGYRSRVGQNLQYWVHTARGRSLACVVFGAPAWQCAVRDRWIGWTAAQRAARLGWILNNTRFLILPWVQVPHLASHLLGRVSRQLRADWQAKYRQPLDLLETFVDRQRFTGTCYRAANWICLGTTRGRGRQGAHEPSTSIKDVYVYPLHRHCRQHLTSDDPDCPACAPIAESPDERPRGAAPA